MACASYDYMKLMVLELQQQLSELEEAERSAQQGSVSNGHEASEPRAPPRQRQNPFNSAGEDKARIVTKMQWQHLHREFGTNIVRDRESWCRSYLATKGPLL